MEYSECRNKSGLPENAKRSLSNLYPSSIRLFSLENLSEDLRYLLDKSILTDIQLKCGCDIIPAHKVILAARSKVFSAMIQHEMIESKSGIIDIKDVEPFVLRTFVSYLYSGEIFADLSEDVLCKLYTVSDEYAVPVLQKLCSSNLAKMLKEENIIDLLILADAHSDEDLKGAVAKFFNEKPSLLKKDKWISFSEQNPSLTNEIYQKYIAQITNK